MPRAPKYRQRVDGNQAEIVKALRQVGCSVIVIGKPVDLLVGYRAHNFLIEVKDPDSDYGKYDPGTKEQNEFIANWKGQVRKVYTTEEAIELVSKAYTR